jgi:hypothetical protein
LNKSTVEKIVAGYVRQVKPGINTPCRVIRDACVARLQAEGATMEAVSDMVGGLKTTRRKEEIR